MKVTVIGAGAMGGLFGSLLQDAGRDVWLVDIWPEHVREIQEKGLGTESAGRVRRIKLNITTDYREVRPADLIIIFTKHPQTADAARAAKEILAPEGLILTLQNGLGNPEIIAREIAEDRIVAGNTLYGSTLLGPGSILHSSRALTHIGPWSGASLARVEEVADFFRRSGLRIEVVEDINTLRWNKLIINVGINAIAALTGIKNGELLDLEITKEISRAAQEEAIRVAELKGYRIRADAVEFTFEIAKQAAMTRASMGQDAAARRQTEIMAINGAVVTMARELGLEVPVNKTLTGLVRTLESHYPS